MVTGCCPLREPGVAGAGHGQGKGARQPTTLVHHGGELEAEALAERSRCLQVDIVAVEGGLDDVALMGSCFGVGGPWRRVR